jgi:hypothetical protein
MNDDLAASVIERRMYVHFLEDLRKANFPVDQLTDNNGIAVSHMKLRAHGHGVRSLGEILAASKADYEQWRGGHQPRAPQPPPAARQPAPRRAEPRIEVKVNRDARRTSIPTQPPYAASPQRRPEILDQPERSATQVRSAAVAKMQELRRRGRGAAV